MPVCIFGLHTLAGTVPHRVTFVDGHKYMTLFLLVSRGLQRACLSTA